MTREIDKVMKRIRALLAKTLENGATEAEALEAAQKAAELMARYHIDSADLADGEEDFHDHAIKLQAQWQAPAYVFIAAAIGELTGTLSAQTKRGRTVIIWFYGRESDALFAQWLCQALGDFIIAGYLADANTIRLSAAPPAHAGPLLRKAFRTRLTRWRNGYLLGATNRISERIGAIVKAQRPPIRPAAKPSRSSIAPTKPAPVTRRRTAAWTR